MNNELTIQKTELSDLHAVLDLYAQLDDEEILDLESGARIFKKIRSYPDYSVYVAKMNGRIIGAFELLIMDNLAHRGTPSGIIEDVVVDEKFRSKGIGRKMMEYAMDRCREKGCYKLVLSSNLRRDRAHRFYESLGFKKHGYSFLIEL